MQDLDFGISLALAYQAFVRELHEELARHGLTELGASYGYILRTVEAGPTNQRQLAERLEVSEQAIGKTVNEMVRRKFLARRVDPDDARARRLALGPKGEATLRHAKQFHARFEAKLVRELGDDVAATRRVLARIIDARGHANARLRLVV
jgi:DNA-binding MarR family transcriptional regulator